MVGFDVAVVGAGITGSSAAWHLKTMDPSLSVGLLDTHPVIRGATAYSAGIIRRHHSLESDARLAADSVPFFQNWKDIVGGTCGYVPDGFLFLINCSQKNALSRNLRHADLLAKTAILRAGEVRSLFPELLISDDMLGVFEPEGGYADPVRATQSLQGSFLQMGGSLMRGVKVGRVDSTMTNRPVQIESNIGTIEANHVLVAAGADFASIGIVGEQHLPLVPRRIGLARFHRHRLRPRNLPACIDDTTGTYFVPAQDGTVAVGVRARPEAAPDSAINPLTLDEINEALSRVSQRLDSFSADGIRGSQVSSDGYTPDSRPVLGRALTSNRVSYALGMSGGGFKIAPQVGRLTASAILDESKWEALDIYSAARFNNGALLRGTDPYVYL